MKISQTLRQIISRARVLLQAKAALITTMVTTTLTAAMLSPCAWAAPAAQHTPEQSLMSMLPMLVIFVAVFYFLLVRPQNKRAKQQKELMNSLQLGDEVLTSSGIVGRITKLRDNYISVMVSKDTEIMLQKNAIAHVVPKGTLEFA